MTAVKDALLWVAVFVVSLVTAAVVGLVPTALWGLVYATLCGFVALLAGRVPGEAVLYIGASLMALLWVVCVVAGVVAGLKGHAKQAAAVKMLARMRDL